MLTYRQRAESDDVPGYVRGPHRNLYLDIRNLLLSEVSSDLDEEYPLIKRLAVKIRRDLDFQEMSNRSTFKAVAGADAGSQVLPLASRRYAVISALVYSLPMGFRFFLAPESIALPYSLSGEKFKGTVSVRREAMLYETACSFVESYPSSKLVLIDGPLAFSNWWGMTGQRRDRQRLIDAVNRFLLRCMEEDIVVAGVVKRPSARYLVYYMGLQDETDLPDAFLLLQTLHPGERTGVFSPRAALRRVVRAAPFIEALDYPIYSFYGRFSRNRLIPPIRIDLPAFSLGYLDEVANYCHWSGFWNGVPLPILRADEEVRISKRVMAEIYTDILSYVGRRTGEVSYLAPCWGEGGWMGV